jgi:hypothetical protein
VDAQLDYTAVEARSDTYLARFVEVDRGTTSARALATKLESYARLEAWAPGWAGFVRFPGLLVVLCAQEPAAAARRIVEVSRRAEALPSLSRAGFGAWATTLDEVEAVGPFGAIWTPLLGPGSKVDLFG